VLYQCSNTTAAIHRSYVIKVELFCQVIRLHEDTI